MSNLFIGVVLGSAIGMAGIAMAQTGGSSSPASQAYMQAMQTMDDSMRKMIPTGDADMDFAMMMIPHHQAGVDMAQTLLKDGKDPQLKRMAMNIISSQQKEIKEMEAWQKKHGM
jgi:uncharacterized protein (DUF305 family)